MPEKPAAEPWHLDRRIPIALILAIIGQTAGALTGVDPTKASVNVRAFA